MGHQGTTVHGKSLGAPKPAVCHLSRYTQAFWEDGNLHEVAAGDGKVPLPCDETLEIGVGVNKALVNGLFIRITSCLC